eukprot:1312645-Lingulodinium_polyedra.AAC.1
MPAASPGSPGGGAHGQASLPAAAAGESSAMKDWAKNPASVQREWRAIPRRLEAKSSGLTRGGPATSASGPLGAALAGSGVARPVAPFVLPVLGPGVVVAGLERPLAARLQVVEVAEVGGVGSHPPWMRQVRKGPAADALGVLVGDVPGRLVQPREEPPQLVAAPVESCLFDEDRGGRDRGLELR